MALPSSSLKQPFLPAPAIRSLLPRFYHVLDHRPPARQEIARPLAIISSKTSYAWLAGIAGSVAALNFRPVEQMFADADACLHAVEEGAASNKLVGLLYEEQGRKAVGDFPLTAQVRGYCNRGSTEIDLIANDEAQLIRFGSCKEMPTKA